MKGFLTILAVVAVIVILLMIILKNIFPGSYSSVRPGPSCDQGGGIWATDLAFVDCTSVAAGTLIGSTDGELARVGFVWRDHPFPRDYSVEVDISSLTKQACAGVTTRSKASSGYFFFICADGGWGIVRYDSTNGENPTSNTLLAQGSVANSVSYHLKAISKGDTQQITIDNGDLKAVTDPIYIDTAYISLVVSGPSDTGGSAIFSNFTYIPM